MTTATKITSLQEWPDAAAPPVAAPAVGTVTINGLDYRQMTDIVLDSQGRTRDHLPVPSPPVEDDIVRERDARGGYIVPYPVKRP